MASNTDRFGLLKKDPTTDGNDTFNIKTMLNDNWDKLDSAAKMSELEDHENKKDNPHKVTKTHVGLGNVDNIQQASKVDFESHKADKVVHITAEERSNWNNKETPTGAQQKASNAEKNAKDYTDSQLSTQSADFSRYKADNENDKAKMNINIMDLAIELETMKMAELTGVNANIFIETFQNLNDVVVERGGYDSVNKRLEV